MAGENVFLSKDPRQTDQNRLDKLDKMDEEERNRRISEVKQSEKEEQEKTRKEGVWRELKAQSDHLNKANLLMEQSFNLSNQELSQHKRDTSYHRKQQGRKTNPFIASGYTGRMEEEGEYSFIPDVTRPVDVSRPPPYLKNSVRSSSNQSQDTKNSHRQYQGGRGSHRQSQDSNISESIEQLKNLLEESWHNRDKAEREKISLEKRLNTLSKDYNNLLEQNKQQSFQLNDFKSRANQIIDQDLEQLRQREQEIETLKEDVQKN